MSTPAHVKWSEKCKQTIEIQYTGVRVEGRSPEITVATGKEAREPKTYLSLGVGQTIIGLLSHVTE